MAWSTQLRQAKTIAYVHIASISAYFECDLPTASFGFPPERGNGGAGAVKWRGSWWLSHRMCLEAGWRPFKPFHLYFIPSSKKCGFVDTVVIGQTLSSVILEVISNPYATMILWIFVFTDRHLCHSVYKNVQVLGIYILYPLHRLKHLQSRLLICKPCNLNVWTVWECQGLASVLHRDMG